MLKSFSMVSSPLFFHNDVQGKGYRAGAVWSSAMRCVALGRKNFLFVGSKGGGKSAAIACTLIETAKLNGVNPQAWLSHVLGRIADHKITRLDELTPWRYAAAAA